jgi:hypothetical protein
MKRYKRVLRRDPKTDEMKPYIRITETRVKVRFVAVSKIQARKLENQKMLDAQE